MWHFEAPQARHKEKMHFYYLVLLSTAGQSVVSLHYAVQMLQPPRLIQKLPGSSLQCEIHSSFTYEYEEMIDFLHYHHVQKHRYLYIHGYHHSTYTSKEEPSVVKIRHGSIVPKALQNTFRLTN